MTGTEQREIADTWTKAGPRPSAVQAEASGGHPSNRRPVDRARRLGPEIAEQADEIERTRRIPGPLLGALHRSGLLALFLPERIGGEEVRPSEYLRAITELGRFDGSIAWNAFVANSAALITPYLEPDVARKIYADETALMAWGPPNQCHAQAVDGGYLVDGEWGFASGCRQATWMGAHCQVLEADGRFRLNRAGKPTVRSLLFPANQATLIDNWNPIGLRGTASDGYRVESVFVPESHSTTREDPTLPRLPGRLFAFPMQGLYAVGVAGVALGIARAMLDAFITLADQKTPRGLVRLAESATVQANVAQAEAKLSAAFQWLLSLLDEIYESASEDAPIEIPDRARVRLGCAHAIQSATEVGDTMHRAGGIDAIFPGDPFERRFRDLHTVTQQIQSRTAHFEAVGQVLLGQNPTNFL